MGGRHTAVDKWPGAHVHGTPHAPALRKVPPEAALITEHVAPWLLVVVQCFDVAWRAWVRRREELVDRVALCTFGARQREGRAEEGAKARWAVQIDPWLCVVGLSVRRVCQIRGGDTYWSATRSERFWMRKAKDVAQKSGDAHDMVRCNAKWLTVGLSSWYIAEKLTVHVGHEYLIHLRHLENPASFRLERELSQGALSTIYHCGL